MKYDPVASLQRSFVSGGASDKDREFYLAFRRDPANPYGAAGAKIATYLIALARDRRPDLPREGPPDIASIQAAEELLEEQLATLHQKIAEVVEPLARQLAEHRGALHAFQRLAHSAMQNQDKK